MMRNFQTSKRGGGGLRRLEAFWRGPVSIELIESRNIES